MLLWRRGIIANKRICNWYGCNEVIIGRGNIKYCQRHRADARKERSRQTSKRHYDKNKKRINIKEIGTTSKRYHPKLDSGPSYLGVTIPFYAEFESIQKLKNQLNFKSVRGYSKEGKDKLPYQYITRDDFHKFNVTYTMRAYRKCPFCKDDDNRATMPRMFIKDLKRAEIICQKCGTVLNAPNIPDDGKGGNMAFTNRDIAISQYKNPAKKPIDMKNVQSVAWSNFFTETKKKFK